MANVVLRAGLAAALGAGAGCVDGARDGKPSVERAPESTLNEAGASSDLSSADQGLLQAVTSETEGSEDTARTRNPPAQRDFSLNSDSLESQTREAEETAPAFGTLAQQDPTLWGEVAVWANTWGGTIERGARHLACQQSYLHAQPWMGACAYNFKLSIVRESEDRARVTHVRISEWTAKRYESRTAPPSNATPQEEESCRKYVECVARHAWLGRTVPWSPKLPDSQWGHTRESRVLQGGKSAATEAWTLKMLEDLRIVLQQMDVHDGTQLPVPRTVQDVQARTVASQLAFVEWQLRRRPWDDWQQFVREALP